MNYKSGTTGLDRRDFLGGLTGVLAAAAYTLDVPETVAGQLANDEDGDTQTVASPDGRIEVTVDVSSDVPTYSVAFEGETYVDSSALGFDFQNQQSFGTAADGTTGPALTVTGSESGTETENWDPIWDQYESVTADYNVLRVGLAETAGPSRSATLEFRVFDDGLGFRVALGEAFASNSDSAVVTSENTQFNFAGDYTAWWIKNEFVNPRFEQEYEETALSDVEAGTRTIRPNGNAIRNGVHTPLTVKASDDAYLSVHEADLTDYATMSLAPRSDSGGTDFAAELAPLPDGTKVSTAAPTVTPWRTIQIGTTPGDLVESSMIPLLNDDLDESVLPTVDGEPDTSWITPKKYIGIWWTMIAGNANWWYKSDAEIAHNGDDPAGYIHGARTERMKRYMRFASENSIDSVLVEGWNVGWESYMSGPGTSMDFGQSSPDFSLTAVTDYGQSLSPSVEMTAHNETAGNVDNYEEQILTDDIFQFYEDNDIRSIKNGYVSDPGLVHESSDGSPTINHHCQIAVNHHELVAREAAGNRQLLERHEADKPTGKRRTYPNLAATETVKAQEFDGFEALASNLGAAHHVELPFTRMLAGPTSFQPGIFDVTFNDDTGGQIQTTRAKQLAMYPTYNAGMQMAADRIEAYINPELGVGELVQAAAGDLGGFVTADNWRDAFGTNYVAVDPNRVPSGSSVSWTVTDVPADGTYDLHLRYASDGETNANRVLDAGHAQATLRVNDSTATLELPLTEHWDDWQVFTTSVELTEGDNTVAVELDYDDSGGEFTGDVGGFNLNTVAVTEQGAASPVPSDYAGYTPENENFETEPEFAFLEAVPAGGWDDTTVIDAEIGDYTVTARESGDEWFVGTMTGDRGRALDVPLQFLTPGCGSGQANERSASADGSNAVFGPKYVAEIYSDGIDAGVDEDPTDVRIDEAIVDPSTTVLASVVPSGGQAIRLRKASGREETELPEYERPEQRYESLALPDAADVSFPFEVEITGSHTGQFIGGEELNVYANGERVATVLVRFSSTRETDSFSLTFDQPGEYEITVGQSPDDTLPAQTITVRDPYAAALPERYSTFASAPAEFGRSDDRILINAAGEDVESYADEYGTVYVDDGLGESGTVTAAVLDQEQTNPFAKSGIMVRNDITGAGESPGYLLVATAPRLGPFMHVDADGDGLVDSFIGAEVPYSFPTHLRLEKDGTTFTGFASTDGGSTFTEIGTVDLSTAAERQDAGMFVTSHNEGTKSRVAFGDFEITE
ncbi:glycoside hydrolase family 97 catalytic domain-containing protein [Haloarcula pellucida]|uniref:glycoside hydrolase family 97 catalytic domain-containing protein n=1 Tax=Haloarcula pellucida TaxID=1427151 RepID=UPI0016670BC3|nr:glycoside hydrolase family 97 catalytic domain-containing protein [Halomicroarcula pellucida]MBX0348723.1 glycoside hydrolase family 97 catalytic domain-containing protein [Halomicroarcula pellucida]